MTMRISLLACLMAWLAVIAVDAKKASPFYRIDEKQSTSDEKPRRLLEHAGPRRHLQRQLEPATIRSSDYDAQERRLPRRSLMSSSLHNAGGTRSAGHSYASTYNHHVKEEEKKYEDVSTHEGDYEYYYEDNDADKGKYGAHTDDEEYYYYSYTKSSSSSSHDGDDDDGGDGSSYGKGRGGKGYRYSSSSSSSRSSKSSKSSKSEKSEKHSKSGSSSSSHDPSKPTPKPALEPTAAPTTYTKPPGHKDYIRFVMVREEAGTPVPGYFGIGDSLALNGQVYYWEGVGDKVISDVPSGNFVALCTGVTGNDDLLCTYEIVLKVAKEYETSTGVGVLTAHGVNYYEENDMVVTGTEFDFGKYHGGTLVTVEDPVQPYLYATLYLI